MGSPYEKIQGKAREIPPVVAIYPFGYLNPYQVLLGNELEKKGCEVLRLSRVDKTMPFHLLKSCRTSNVLHLHWISGLYTGKSRLRFVIRTLLFCFTLLLLRIRGIRLVLTLHNLSPHDVELRSYHLIARRLIAICVHTIVVHSVPAKQMAINYIGSTNKFKVIFHGRYSDYYPNKVSKVEARALLNIHTNKKIVLFLGAIRPYKGIEELLLAAKELGKQNMVILIAGNGENHYLDLLRKDLPKNVILHRGFVADKKVQYYMNAADCLILPYRDSLTSGAAILGLSFGLPIVGTNTVAFKHLIDNKLCVACEPNDPKSISRAMQEVFSWNYSDFKKRCDDFLRECGWDKIAEEHLKAYGK